MNSLKIAEESDPGISTQEANRRAIRDPASRVNFAPAKAILASACMGAVIGATWGWIAGIGALAIPGVGLFFVGEPIIAGMIGATLGAALGGICGGLIGMDVPEIESKR